MKRCKLTLLFLLYSCSYLAHCAVILQYHHVLKYTSSGTSISPSQFEKHLQYLEDNNFNVVPLSDIMNSIKKQQPLLNKTVAITFDDGYRDVLDNAKPLLDKFNYPYTIFINPTMIDKNFAGFLSWQQLKLMADQGAIIANHGLDHHSLARIPQGFSEQQWLEKQTILLIEAEQLIRANTGQNWQYLAFPFGEFTPAVQAWLTDLDYIGFSQQSGAVGLATDLTAVPRYPVSAPYDQIPKLVDKLNSLPFTMRLSNDHAKTVHKHQQSKSITFEVIVDDFNPTQLNCYISGLGKQKIDWLNQESFTVTYSAPLPVGRVRCNCTAPSISEPGRYYWYSKPWFILQENGDWYPL
ncbi:MAG: peptidoglycan/xylan/chitin deacetylase (PgdA/CDA1 family) [Alteromonadaceae bacterium]|jgi:peptidoglycan/xylan/chitin deacetylase (PgdA/CDA1 family)